MGTFQFYIPGQIGSLLIYVDMCLYIYIYIFVFISPEMFNIPTKGGSSFL